MNQTPKDHREDSTTMGKKAILIFIVFMIVIAIVGVSVYMFLLKNHEEDEFHLVSGIIEISPKTVNQHEEIDIALYIRNDGQVTVNIKKINLTYLYAGNSYYLDTVNESSDGWYSSSVLTNWTSLVYGNSYKQDYPPGEYEIKAVFHTSQGIYEAKQTYTIVV